MRPRQVYIYIYIYIHTHTYTYTYTHTYISDNDDAPLSPYRYLSTSIPWFQRYLFFRCVSQQLALNMLGMQYGISSVNIR